MNDKFFVGMELGSTTIKAVAIDCRGDVIARGAHLWENSLKDGIWTYSAQQIDEGIKACMQSLNADFCAKKGTSMYPPAAFGVSAMMHGYMALDKNGKLLAPFKTWRNTDTGEAAEALSKLFGFNIPMRWSVAHLYKAILGGEAHTKQISYLTTLAGYVHLKLTGERALGIGDASGMFPIDSEKLCYNAAMTEKFDVLVADKNLGWKIEDILPKPFVAGTFAGRITEEGAALLGLPALKGVPVCPPEGDAGTGMVATGCVRPRTANVSAGTSVFSMAVLEKPLSPHKELDMVTTPCGDPVAMVHCNNCTSDLNAWASIFSETASLFGSMPDFSCSVGALFAAAESADPVCGGIVACGYVSGEHVTEMTGGIPLVARKPGSVFNLANLSKSLLYSSLASLRIGMEITAGEGVETDEIVGHGGFFKTPIIGQKIMSAALGAPVTVMPTAVEGGAWGIALLAAFLCEKGNFFEFLDKIFANFEKVRIDASYEEKADFDKYLIDYKKLLSAERKAVELLCD